MLEQGTQAPSPAPDLIPAENERQNLTGNSHSDWYSKRGHFSAMNRSDMCETGLYSERGIKGLDGYQTEYVVDHEQYIVRVPPELEAVGVLTEPFSVVEKAIAEAMQLQLIRLPDSSASRDWYRESAAWSPDWARLVYWRQRRCACVAPKSGDWTSWTRAQSARVG